MLKLLFSLMLISATVFGQDSLFYCENITSQEQYNFPVFHSKQRPLVAEKINQLLQISELRMLKGFEENNIFESVTVDDHSIYGRRISILDSVLDISKKLISVKFKISSCGSTCNYWTTYYNFNSGNGDMIQLEDIITDSLYNDFQKYIASKVVDQIKKGFYKDTPDSCSGDAWCNFTIKLVNNLSSFDEFYIKDNTLYVDCIEYFHKNMLPSDMTETLTAFSSQELKMYLNDFGKSIFGITDSISRFRSNRLPQLYSGKIGTEQIIMVLNDDGLESIQGEYVYTKYGHGIFISGRKVKDWIEMDEYDSAGKKVGQMEATIKGMEILGTWSNVDKSKTYPFFIKRR